MASPRRNHSLNADKPGRSGILAGGNWIVDRPKLIDVYPVQDTLANILQETSSNGGAAYNVLIDLARLQAPFPLEAVGLVGDDEAGEFIRADCRAHGIDTRQLHTCKEAPTSSADVGARYGGGPGRVKDRPTGQAASTRRRRAACGMDASRSGRTTCGSRIYSLEHRPGASRSRS